MTPCITGLSLPQPPGSPRVEVSFDGPDTSSDGGWLLLQRVDEELGLTEAFAALLPDDRDPLRTEHSRLEQLRQRVYQIAMGYEDCNDADTLRHDPLLKTVCARTPNDEGGLSSQPTLSRFENAMGMRTVKRMINELEQSYVDELPEDTDVVVLDIDTTNDETHGNQQLTFFHGFYDHYLYHPQLVFDGLSRQLVTVILRPGNTHASRGAMSLLIRIIRRIESRFPAVQIAVRADSGFCVPRILDALEHLDDELGDISYILGMAKNPVLLRKSAQLLGLRCQLLSPSPPRAGIPPDVCAAQRRCRSCSRTRTSSVRHATCPPAQGCGHGSAVGTSNLDAVAGGIPDGRHLPGRPCGRTEPIGPKRPLELI